MMKFKKNLPRAIQITDTDKLVKCLQKSNIHNVTLSAIPDHSDTNDVKTTLNRIERMVKNHTNQKTDLLLVSIIRDESAVI